MKKKLIVITKYFKFLYVLYNFMGSLFVNVLKAFIKPKNNVILFISFGGKKYDDSPKAIYEAMLIDSRFDGYKFVWAFQNPDKFDIPKGKKIKTDTINYFINALQARCWITNSTIERGLNFKGKKTFYFNTWHGTPIKKMGKDILETSKSFKAIFNMNVDIMTSQSDYETCIFSRVFDLPKDKFLKCGLPRNDILIDQSKETKVRMMKLIGLPLDKKVILYTPTYREYLRDENLNCIISPPIDFARWKAEIGDEYIVLIRAHYEVTKVFNIHFDNKFVFDVSDYTVLNDLMLASDILISDYSSIFFDYSILNRPMLYFTYDYDTYSRERGMYFDIRNEILGSNNEKELINLIKDIDKSNAIFKVRNFRTKYVERYGNATEVSLNTIYENVKD